MAYYMMGKGLGHYFARYRPNHSASSAMFDFLTELSQQWARKHPGYPFGLGDISRARKEHLPYDGHRTHTYGSAVDIFIIGTKERANSGLEQRTKAQLEFTDELLAKVKQEQSPPKSKPNQPKETGGNVPETAEVVFASEERIDYSQTQAYDLERTTALVDLILDLKPNWPIFQFIYDDLRVRPEVRYEKWWNSRRKEIRLPSSNDVMNPKTKFAGTECHFPMDADAEFAWQNSQLPPPGSLRESGIISVDQPKHADHIHIQLK